MPRRWFASRGTRSPTVDPPMGGGRGDGGREVFRLTPPIILWWVWVAFVAANLVDLVAQGFTRSAVTPLVILATVTGVAYGCALRPRVIADDDGVVVVNPLRDHRIPWGAVRAVDTREWVRVHYVSDRDGGGGREKVVDCWALHVSARARRRSSRGPRNPARRFAVDGRLPQEAVELMSLPLAAAIAARLDSRARRARDRGPFGGTATVSWAWSSIAAMLLPAVALIVVLLVNGHVR